MAMVIVGYRGIHYDYDYEHDYEHEHEHEHEHEIHWLRDFLICSNAMKQKRAGPAGTIADGPRFACSSFPL